MKASENRLQTWLAAVQRLSTPLDLAAFLAKVLKDFAFACAEAVERKDIAALREWIKWCESEASGQFFKYIDPRLARWRWAWFYTILKASLRIAQGPFLDLPQELSVCWKRHFDLLPLPLAFWHDLVAMISGRRPPIRKRTVAVFPLISQDQGIGILVRLELEALDWELQGGGVFPDPALMLARPMDREFIQTWAEAAKAANLEEWVRVRLLPLVEYDEAYLANALLIGPSGSGALYLGLRALQQGLALDPDMAISFIVRDARIQPAGEIRLKAYTCVRYGQFKLMVAADDDLPKELERPDLHVLQVKSLAEAEALGLGLSRALMLYLQELHQDLDRTPWRDPNGTQLPVSRIAVPIRVRTKGFPFLMENEISRIRRAVILGSPGHGKTFLTRWMVLRIADECRREFTKNPILKDLPFPVHMDLSWLVEQIQIGDSPEKPIIRRLMQYGLQEEWAERLGRLLRESERSWLVLDGLDQVPGDRWGVLRIWLSKVDSWSCRIVLTCRTTRYNRLRIPWRELTEYELEPLNSESIIKLFKQWLGDDPGEALWGKVEENPALLKACRSPLIASLICQMNQQRGAPEEIPLEELYDQVLRALMHWGWERQGQDKPELDLESYLSLLREVAWELLNRDPESGSFSLNEMREALFKAIQGGKYNKLHADEVLRELMEAGILQVQDMSPRRGELRLTFLHRSFMEHLAGQALARRVKDDWKGWKDWVDRKAWHPSWWVVMVFMGWTLPEKWLKNVIGLLADHRKDDYFRHRLFLALWIQKERGGGGNLSIDWEVSKIQQEIGEAGQQYLFPWNMLKDHSDLHRSMHDEDPAPRQGLKPPENKNINALLREIEKLVTILQDEDADWIPRYQAAKRLGELGAVMREMMAQPEIIEAIEALVFGLRDKNEMVRAASAEALGEIGPAAAFPEAVKRLIRGLRDPHPKVRIASAKVLGGWHRQGLRFFRNWFGQWSVRTVEDLSAFPPISPKNVV